MTLFCPTQQTEIRRVQLYEGFVAAYNDLVRLNGKLKDIIGDICDIILECGFNVLRYYLEAAVKRVVFFIDKCNLHYNGKCLRLHQKKSETDYIVSQELCSNLKGSFESDDNPEHPPKLTARSYRAMYYFKVAIAAKTSSIREQDVHEKGREIDQMKILAYKLVETDLYNALFKRTNVRKKGLTVILKDRPTMCIRITPAAIQAAKETDNLELSEDIWVTNMFNVDHFNIFASDNSKMYDNIMQLKLNLPKDAANNVLFDHRKLFAVEPVPQAIPSNVSASSSTKKSSFVPPSASAIHSVNTAYGVGKRKFSAAASVESPPATTDKKSCEKSSPAEADRYVSAEANTPRERDTPLCSQESVVRGKRSRQSRHQYNVGAADALSTDSKWWEDNEVADNDIGPAFKKLSRSKSKKHNKPVDKYATVRTPGGSSCETPSSLAKNSSRYATSDSMKSLNTVPNGK